MTQSLPVLLQAAPESISSEGRRKVMILTDSQVQALVRKKLGAGDCGRLIPLLPTLWTRFRWGYLSALGIYHRREMLKCAPKSLSAIFTLLKHPLRK